MDWQLLLLRLLLGWKTKKRTIVRSLRGLEQWKRPVGREGRIKVAALQLELFTASRVEEYVRWLATPVVEARRRGAQLVLLPENITLPLLGLLPGLEGRQQSEEGPDPGDVFRFVSPYFANVYLAILKYLARSTSMYIGGGSLPLREGDRLLNMGYFFSPTGRVLFRQAKVNLMPIEAAWHMSPGQELNTAEVMGTKVAMPVCMDATYFETFRIACALGVEIVLIPIADLNPQYSEPMALRGTWARVQETPVYGVKSALVGEVFGFKFTGRAGIYAPGPLTADNLGILKEADDPRREGMVVVDLDLCALRKFRSDFPPLNLRLYRRYFPQNYNILQENYQGEIGLE